MRSLVLLLIVVFVFSCAQKENKTEEPIKSSESNSKIIENVSWDSTLIIGEGTIWRSEKIEGSNNWDKIRIVNIFGFKKEPKVGDSVQVIPLVENLPTLSLKITKTTPRDDFETGTPDWFEVELEEVTEKVYFEFQGPKERRAEYPGEVAIVYPLIKTSKYLKNIDFDKITLPANVTKSIIKGALDFNNDALPDVLICEFVVKIDQHVKTVNIFVAKRT